MEILTLGEKIKARRKSLHLTLIDVAGGYVTPAQLSYIESDKCRPSDHLLRYICSKINLDMEYVLESQVDQAKRYCKNYIDSYDVLIEGGDYKEASNCLLKVEDLSRKYGLDRYSGIASYKNGTYYYEQGDYDSAEYSLLTALQIFMKFEDRKMMSDCYYCLSRVSLKRGYEENTLIYLNCAKE